MDDKTQAARDSERDAPDRAAERADVAEPDAPTAAEQNEGHSTILSGEPADGVQDNASEE
ncbi:MAG TPA: hypothetical protein VF546_02965 [Pyrinomonadaceae bacterium]|jgi:hypothetical protein